MPEALTPSPARGGGGFLPFDAYERAQWADKAEAYRDSFAALCAYPASALLDAAGVTAATHLLDVGTGTGTVAQLARNRGARAVAVDASPDMLSLAREHTPVCLAALPHLPFATGSFDAVTANFVLNHVGDPAAALTEMRRVVHRDGRIAVTIWPQPPGTAQQLWTDLFAAAGVVRPADLPRVAAEHDFPRTADGLATLLDRTGFTDVTCDVVTWVHDAHPESWWNGLAAGIGSAGALLRRQDDATIARIRAHYDTLTAAHRGPDGRLALPTRALLASAGPSRS